MKDKPISRKEVREIVENQEDSITRIINPEDLTHQDIDSWEEVDMVSLKDELHTSLDEWSYMATHPYESLIQELAVSLYVNDMVRIPFDDLNHRRFTDRGKCVIEGYWLYDMSISEVVDRVNENKEEIEYFHEYEQEAQMFIESCVIDAQVKELEE